MIAEYATLDAVRLADLVASRAISAVELLETAIASIERLNPALNAVVHKHYDFARRAIAQGLPQGRFTGVPFLLKDLDLGLAGTELTHGSRLFAGQVSDHDSTLVARYKAAGLVILGKTNSAELGLSFATEPLGFGPTRHPASPLLSPGGSSGGSAAAVAAGMVPMAHATDGGGSIRQPAALTGLFGLKPSRGRTPPGPLASETFFGLSVSHAVTRTLRDSAALLDATHGPEPGSLHALPAPTRAFEDCVKTDPPALRIAFQRHAFGGVPVDPACEGAAEAAAELCSVLGHEVEEAAPPLDDVPFTALFRCLAGALSACAVEDFARRHAIADPLALIEPVNAAWIEEGRRSSGMDLVRALGAVQAVGRAYAAFFSRYDVLLSPVIASASLPIGWLSGAIPDLDRQIARMRDHAPLTFPYNAAGCPALSLPFGPVSGLPAGQEPGLPAGQEPGLPAGQEPGLPIGVQIAAAVGREDLLFALAGQIGRARA